MRTAPALQLVCTSITNLSSGYALQQNQIPVDVLSGNAICVEVPSKNVNTDSISSNPTCGFFAEAPSMSTFQLRSPICVEVFGQNIRTESISQPLACDFSRKPHLR